MVMNNKNKCIICGERPAIRSLQSMCKNCFNHIEREKKLAKQTKIQRNPPAHVFITYHDNTIKGIRIGDIVKFSLFSGNLDKQPKSKIINLNMFLPEYNRDQIKKFKAAVAKLSPVHPV